MAKWISFAVKPTSTHKRDTQKKRLTHDQVDLLEKSFISNKKLEPGLKLQLAGQLGITPRQVAIWYQNKRARWKNQSLEHDHDVLQTKLEMALTEKKRLENEVEKLKQELEETQKMVIDSRGLNNQTGPPPSLAASCHSTSDDGGSSIFHGDVEVSFENGEVLRSDEELFVSLMAENGSIWN